MMDLWKIYPLMVGILKVFSKSHLSKIGFKNRDICPYFSSCGGQKEYWKTLVVYFIM